MLKNVTKQQKQLFGILVIFAIFAFCGTAIAGQSMTIVGTINDDGVLVDQKGELYIIVALIAGNHQSGKSAARIVVSFIRLVI